MRVVRPVGERAFRRGTVSPCLFAAGAIGRGGSGEMAAGAAGMAGGGGNHTAALWRERRADIFLQNIKKERRRVKEGEDAPFKRYKTGEGT